MVSDGKNSTDLMVIVRESYIKQPEPTADALAIAIREATKDYVARVSTLDVDQATRLGLALHDSAQIAERVLEHLKTLGSLGDLSEDSVHGHALYGLAAQLTSALRLSPEIINNETAQLIITDALGVVNDIADVSASDFYLGRNPVSENANRFVGEYFAAVPFNPSIHEMRKAVTPADLILHDWGAAVRYCQAMGVPKEAFLRDETALFRFAPDALPYVFEHKDEFPGLELRKVNDGTHVEGWLTSAKIGVGSKNVTRDNWLVLLTGYIPEDNAAIPRLNERYTAPLLVTALDVQNRR